MQKELYTLTAITLQSRHSVQQLQQDNVVISTVNTEDSDATETSAVCDLHAQKACCNKYDISTLNTKDSDTTETSVIHYLHTHKASCKENDKSVMLKDSSMIRTLIVHHLYAHKASCNKNDESIMLNSENDDVTETSAVHNHYA